MAALIASHFFPFSAAGQLGTPFASSLRADNASHKFIEPVYANRVEPRSVQQHAEHLTVQQSCTTQWDTERKKKCRLSHPMSTGCSLDSGQPLHQSRPTTPAGNQAALLVCNRSRHRTEPSVAGRERQACMQAGRHARTQAVVVSCDFNGTAPLARMLHCLSYQFVAEAPPFIHQRRCMLLECV